MKKLLIKLIIVKILFISSFIYGIELIKIGQINQETNVDLYAYDNDLIVCDHQLFKIKLYDGYKVTKTINFTKGNGPGEFRIMNNIVFNEKEIICWDRILGRITKYLWNSDFNQCIKMPIEYNRNALLVGILKDKYIFLHSITSKKSAINITQKLTVYDYKKISDIESINGVYAKNKSLNYNNSCLLATVSGDYICYEDSIKGIIYLYNINTGEKTVLDDLSSHKLTWKDKYYDLRYKVSEKHKNEPKVIFPDKLPILFGLISSNNLICAITNEAIDTEETVLRIYKDKKFLGKVKIPLIMNQHFIFNSPLFRFNEGISMSDNHIYSSHYDGKSIEEDCKIMIWKIKK